MTRLSQSNFHRKDVNNTDVIMSAMASEITTFTIVYSTVYSGQIKENIKAPLNWPLWGEFTGDRWIVSVEFPTRKASNAENVSIWWRHHDILTINTLLVRLCVQHGKRAGGFTQWRTSKLKPTYLASISLSSCIITGMKVTQLIYFSRWSKLYIYMASCHHYHKNIVDG